MFSFVVRVHCSSCFRAAAVVVVKMVVVVTVVVTLPLDSSLEVMVVSVVVGALIVV